MSFLYNAISYWNKKRDETVTQTLDAHDVNIIRVDKDGTVTIEASENPKPTIHYIPTYGSIGIECKDNEMVWTEVGYDMKITLLNKDYINPFGSSDIDTKVKTIITYKDGKEIPSKYEDGKITLVDEYDYPLTITARLLF